MKIEDEQTSGTFKNDQFVTLVFSGDVGLWSGKPTIMGFSCMHAGVPFVQILVSKERIIHYVPLTACVMEAGVVAGAREIKPFGMAKLVAFKV